MGHFSDSPLVLERDLAREGNEITVIGRVVSAGPAEFGIVQLELVLVPQRAAHTQGKGGAALDEVAARTGRITVHVMAPAEGRGHRPGADRVVVDQAAADPVSPRSLVRERAAGLD